MEDYNPENIKIYVNINGDKFYYIPSDREYFHNYCGENINGILHREDGPAEEWVDGTKVWWLNGLSHREDGVAVESADGSKQWYIKGKRHREDGPAREYANGYKAWFINGQRLSYEQWFEWVMTHSSKDNQINVLLNLNNHQ